MARRTHARIGTDMADEKSIRALDVAPQWLYDRLLMRPEISRCGVVPYRPASWALLAADANERKVRGWVRQLVDGKQIVVDEPHAETLVRTFVRHDGLLSQPNVVANMVYDFGLIVSETVRTAFLIEFRRLWDLDDLSDAERGGWLLAVGHYPRQKHAKDDPAAWPVALTADALARLKKAVGTGIREEFAAALNAGVVQPFDPTSPVGIPEPFAEPFTEGAANPSPNPLAGAPARSPVPSAERRAPSAVTESRVPSAVTDVRAPAATAADTHTPIASPDPETLVTQHGGTLTGAVRIALVDQARQLLDEGIEPVTIAAGLAIWRSRPGSGPRLLSYLVCDLLLEAELPTKPQLHVNGSAPTWCGQCDEHSRWEDAGDGAWRRCPRCHPSAQAVSA